MSKNKTSKKDSIQIKQHFGAGSDEAERHCFTPSKNHTVGAKGRKDTEKHKRGTEKEKRIALPKRQHKSSVGSVEATK